MSEDYFRHDWSASVRLETRWETDIGTSQDTDAEQRRPVLSRPQRFMVARIVSLDRSLLSRLAMTSYRAATQQQDVPLYSDVSIVTADSSGTTLNCDTTFRRFYTKVIVIPWDGGAFGDSFIRDLSATTPTTITVSSALPGTVLAGSLVFPVMLCHQVLETRMSFTTDEIGIFSAEYLEVASGGEVSIPASHAASAPSALPTYQGYPVLTFAHNWTASPQLRFLRTGEAIQVNKDQLVSVNSAKGRWELSLSLTLFDKESFFDVLQFFDSRRGRLLPFWAFAPFAFFSFVQVFSTTQIDIEASFDEDDLAAISYFAVVMSDGTVYVRDLNSYSVVGSSIRLVTSDPLPSLSSADVSHVTMAMLARLADDALAESWDTDQACQVELRAVEILAEAEHTPTGFVPYYPGTEYSACP